MLKLNTDEIRNLQFEVSIQGINYDELQGSLKFIIEDVEYGIPVKIQRDLVSVEVPPLEEIVARGMKNGDIVECKLDIFGNGFYINPWGGQFELATPVKMETKNFNVDNKQPDKKIVAELKQPEVKTQDTLDKESILEMLFEKLEEKGFRTHDIPDPEPTHKKVVKENKKPRKLTRKELVEQKIKSKFTNVNSLIKNVKSLTETKKVIVNPTMPKPAPVRESFHSPVSSDAVDIMAKVQELKDRREGITPKPSYSRPITNQGVEQQITVDFDDPIVLMESVGMKNPKIQQVMLDKAIELGGDGDKAISQTLKKLLGIEKPAGYEQYMNTMQQGI
jgi:hypothetical protein